MSTSAAIPEVARPAFFAGQRLTPEDLSQAVDSARDLRWLHNRALHGAGVALGLEVGGEAGGRQLSVSPGLALDPLGRELILAESATVDVPNVKAASDYRLVISYRKDDDVSAVERAGACGATGAVRRPEGASLQCLEVVGGHDIVLADFSVAGCALVARPDPGGRQILGGACEPYLAAGRSDPAATTWSLWTAGGQVLGALTDVDTSPARFVSTPSYTARIIGGSDYPSPGPSPTASVVGTVSLAAASASGFRVRVRLDIIPGSSNPTIAEVVAALGDMGWHVGWMGVEA